MTSALISVIQLSRSELFRVPQTLTAVTTATTATAAIVISRRDKGTISAR